MDAYIVAVARTPVGRRNGSLAQVHPVDLGAHVLTAVTERAGVDPAAIDDVILGCLDQVGGQAANIARISWLAAGLPETVPGVTLDRQCGSAQQAVHFAAQAVMSGTQDLVIAGGTQNMSAIPMSGTWHAPELAFARPFDAAGWQRRFGAGEVSQFLGADLIAERYGFTRQAMEDYAARSHQRAVKARAAGAFEAEIVPWGDVAHDECPREVIDPDKLASLAPLRDGGTTTAAMASQISDGAAALLVASEAAVREHSLTPIARIHQLTVCGSDPELMLTGPIPATRRVLERAGLTVDDIDTFEVNEAFASVVLAWLTETGADPERTNPNGGAIALGHPLGATGGRLMISMIEHLARTGGRFGLQTMCEGGGMANATIVENLRR